ncbi:MAG TPA: NADP-dependent oxidoreductase [Arenimonas sp.]|nr:NADP-dependent oxidoreductase [Arenimonas sp.]HPW33427.1 NADP-dependent oxidoreductase [Arenimonas sp.]
MSTMRAWQAMHYGNERDSLRLNTVEKPSPAAKEVCIKVHAASLNPIDYKLLHGDLKKVMPMPFPITMGFDAAGVVYSVGSSVTRFKLGDKVYVRASRESLRAFAEYTVQPEAFVAMMPSACNFEESASFPLVALTTVQGFVDRAHLKSGDSILIHAGSGGLGSFAIQYARQMGLTVHTTTSSKNADWVQKLGAEKVFCYDLVDIGTINNQYDAVFDTLGGKETLQAFVQIKSGGVVISVAGPPDIEMRNKFASNPVVRFVMWMMSRKVYAAAKTKNARYFRYLTESSGEQLSQITLLVEQGKIKPVIDRVFPFEQGIEAFEYLVAGRAKGKVIIRIAD